jgi:aminoglycoside 3-N-acetyltransferase
MSEINTISKTKTPVTEKTIIRDLQSMGLNKGEIILVHSSLSAIGWVCGEERTVIEALIKTVGPEGTICMPAHSGGNSDPAEWEHPPVPKEWFDIIYQSMPVFDPDISPTRGIGRIPEAFRTYPGTLRSYHPQTSFCAYGKNAKEITDNHVLTPQLGMDSPLGKLYQLNAKILFLGTGYHTCTSFHMGEALCGNTPIKRQGAALLINQVREWKWFDDFDYDCDDFDVLGKDFEDKNVVIQGKVGNADCRLFDIKTAVDFSVDWLNRNRKYS